jgi:hypothetical protein
MMASFPISSLGGWPLLIVSLLGTLGVGGLLKTWLDYLRGKRKQTDDMADRVVTLTMGRLKAVERHAIICEANLSYTRHKANNLASTIDSMLMLFEVAPERQKEILLKLKDKRERDEKVEAVERASILAAAIAAIGGEEEVSESEVIP